MGTDDLRRRLSRLGIARGSEFKAKPRPEPVSVESLIGGRTISTDRGELCEVSHVHPANSQRGPRALSDWLTQDTHTVADIAQLDSALLPALNDFVFLDTETTGLGGAGALAFMVGIGVFNAVGDFEVRQFFLRDPSEEEALLALLPEIIPVTSALVTFNGRTFDVPLLAGRYLLARRKTHLAALPNVDLLIPARRLWQRRLPSCALGALEADILGVRREQSDVPGSLIPYLYQQYLQTSDGREMARVFYHNEQDILSMAVLAVMMTQAFAEPDMPNMPVEDRLSLARWHERLGRLDQSEAAYRLALDEASNEALCHAVLTQYGAMLKRLDRRDEATPLWERLADLKLDVHGHEELAKYFEWRKADYRSALDWTEAGLRLAESWRPGIRRVEALAALERRQARLIRKLAGQASDDDLLTDDESLLALPDDD